MLVLLKLLAHFAAGYKIGHRALMHDNKATSIIHLSRGLATSFLQEVDKRNNRILLKIEKLHKISKGRIDKSYFDRAERIYSRFPTCISGRGSTRKLFFVHLSRTKINKVKRWHEDGFCFHRGEIRMEGAAPRIRIHDPSIIFSKHALQRIFERLPRDNFILDDVIDVRKTYRILRDIMLWQQFIFAMQINILARNLEIESEEFFNQFLNLSFLVPAQSGALLCEFYASTLYVRTFISEDMLNAYQLEIYNQCKSLPESFKTDRLALHESLGSSAPSGNFLHEKLQVSIISRWLAEMVADNFESIYRESKVGDQIDLASLIRDFVGDDNSKMRIKRIISTFQGMSSD